MNIDPTNILEVRNRFSQESFVLRKKVPVLLVILPGPPTTIIDQSGDSSSLLIVLPEDILIS
jgi:hypothetical protein